MWCHSIWLWHLLLLELWGELLRETACHLRWSLSILLTTLHVSTSVTSSVAASATSLSTSLGTTISVLSLLILLLTAVVLLLLLTWHHTLATLGSTHHAVSLTWLLLLGRIGVGSTKVQDVAQELVNLLGLLLLSLLLFFFLGNPKFHQERLLSEHS